MDTAFSLLNFATGADGNPTGIMLPSGMSSSVFSSIPGMRWSVSGDSELGSCLQTSANTAIYNGLFDDGVSAGTFKSARSPLMWLNALLGQRISFVYNGGLSGKRTDEILVNLPTVLTQPADGLFDNGGANDIDQLLTYAGFGASATTCENAIYDNRTAKWAKARARGVRLIVAFSITPPAVGQGWSATQKGIFNRVNRRLSKAARSIPGVIWFDANTYITDPASTTGLALAGTLYDNLHYSSFGCFLLGRALAKVLDPLLPKYTRNVSNWLDCWQSDTASNNLMEASCGMFTKGTAGTADTNVVGTVCTGWTCKQTTGVGGSATASIVAAPNDADNNYSGVGNAQRLVITTTAQNDTFRWFYFPTINIAQYPAGSSFYVECRVRVRSAVNLNAIYAQASAYFTGSASASPTFSADGFSTYSEPGSGSADLDIVLRSPIVVLPADATAISSLRFELYAKFNGAGAGTIVDPYDAQMVWNR
ncbi:MAG: GDSL-type esterase/lipase family protein [Pseudomonadota bacterium]